MIEGRKVLEIRSDLRPKTYLKRSRNVISNGKEELIGGGLKFPTTTKSFT